EPSRDAAPDLGPGLSLDVVADAPGPGSPSEPSGDAAPDLGSGRRRDAVATDGGAPADGGAASEPPPFLPPTLAPFRAPAYPLVTHDPYFSIWSTTDQVAADWSQHWTGKVQALTSMVRIDGAPYRLLGALQQTSVPALPQQSVRVTPTRTIYAFAGA